MNGSILCVENDGMDEGKKGDDEAGLGDGGDPITSTPISLSPIRNPGQGLAQKRKNAVSPK